MDIARDNEDDKTPKLSVQRIFAGLYSSTEKVRSANEYCTTNDARWAHVNNALRRGSGGLIGVGYYTAEGVWWADGTSILHSGGSPIGSGYVPTFQL